MGEAQRIWTMHIAGEPVPQPRPRLGVRGGHAVAVSNPRGHPVVGWKARVAYEASRVLPPVPTRELVEVGLAFHMERPRSHLRRDGGLRSGVKRAPMKADIDNFAKAVLDALNGIAWHDDRQIVRCLLSKVYADGVSPGVVVRIVLAGEQVFSRP